MKRIARGVFIIENQRIVRKTYLAYFSKSKSILEQEYLNLVYFNKKKKKSIFKVPNQLYFNKKEGFIDMEFIDGKTLNKVLNPDLYEKFGKELKILHKEDKITHGELEVHDIIIKNTDFYVVDLPNLNKTAPIQDYCRFKISIYLYQIKNPLNWFKYEKMARGFTRGYLPNKNQAKKELNKELNSIIFNYWKKDISGKIRSVIILILVKPRLMLKY